MKNCKYFKGDRPCKMYWADRSWDCSNCKHFNAFEERILLIKMDALGDVLRTTPLVEGLKKKYPKSQITWLVKENAIFFIKNNPFIDRIMTYTEENVRILKSEEFDILINLDKDAKGGALASLFNAKDKRGFTWHKEGAVYPLNNAANYHFDICRDNYGGKTRNKKSYQQIIFDISEVKYENEKLLLLFDAGKAESFKQKFFSENKIKNEFIIAVNTGCGPVYPHKKWTYEGHLELIKKLLKDKNVKILLTGAESEVEINQKLMKELKNKNVIDTTNKYNLENFCYLMNCADMILTGDSVALHIAIALKKKIISFFGPTPNQEIDLFGLGKKFVHEELDCLNCYDQFPCPYDGRCMKLITAEEVYNEIQRLR